MDENDNKYRLRRGFTVNDLGKQHSIVQTNYKSDIVKTSGYIKSAQLDRVSTSLFGWAVVVVTGINLSDKF